MLVSCHALTLLHILTHWVNCEVSQHVNTAISVSREAGHMHVYRVGGIWSLGSLVLLYFLTTTVLTATAQEEQTAASDLNKQYQAAFDAMMAAPTDAERAFEFVQVAVKVGD